ncbi:MAG: mechanosensitive ion channel family protein [Bacillota bacterium]
MFVNIFKIIITENSWTAVVYFFLTIIGGGVLITLYQKYISCRFHEKIKSKWPKLDEFLLGFDNRIVAALKVAIIYFALMQLYLPKVVVRALDVVILVTLTWHVVLLIQLFTIQLFKRYIARRTEQVEQDKLILLTGTAVKVLTWIMAILFVMDNLDIQISGLITGLGIGGIALGIASQSIFQDIFSYLTIFIDKPFEIGDFIIIGDFRGTVEHIGIKTTRLRSLGGEQLVFSNTDLTNSRVSNYRRMNRRRINFKFGVTYDTPLEKTEEIPAIVKEIILAQDKTEFDRAHFSAFGDYALIYEVIYYVLDKDYTKYMDIQQQINLGLKGELEQRDISFAFPTQTVHVQQLEKSASNDSDQDIDTQDIGTGEEE